MGSLMVFKIAIVHPHPSLPRQLPNHLFRMEKKKSLQSTENLRLAVSLTHPQSWDGILGL